MNLHREDDKAETVMKRFQKEFTLSDCHYCTQKAAPGGGKRTEKYFLISFMYI